jgi:hypothetical protein
MTEFGITGTALEFDEFIVPGAEEDSPEVRYRRATIMRGIASVSEYVDAEQRKLPNSTMVLIGITKEGQKYRFEVVKDKDGYIDRSGTEGAMYKDDQGHVMSEANLGRVISRSYGQLWMSFLSFVIGLLCWFVSFWLLVQFQWGHALLIAFSTFFVWLFVLNAFSLSAAS